MPDRLAAKARSLRLTKPITANARTRTLERLSRPKGGKTGGADKRGIFALVERGGKVRTFHIDQPPPRSPQDHGQERFPQVHLHTDEAGIYTELGKEFDAIAR